jgi:hypothetical protein
MKEILIDSEFFVSLFAVFLRTISESMTRDVISITFFEGTAVTLFLARV